MHEQDGLVYFKLLHPLFSCTRQIIFKYFGCFLLGMYSSLLLLVYFLIFYLLFLEEILYAFHIVVAYIYIYIYIFLLLSSMALAYSELQQIQGGMYIWYKS
jgi:hypothetical protein